jgi:hypothetical protein
MNSIDFPSATKDKFFSKAMRFRAHNTELATASTLARVVAALARLRYAARRMTNRELFTTARMLSFTC